MASSTQNQGARTEPVMISWEKMRINWIRSAGDTSEDHAKNVKIYLNRWISNNRGFSFTIIQLYDEMFHICITTEQCADIKRKLERKFKIKLPGAVTQEMFPQAEERSRQETFRNSGDFLNYSQQVLVEINKPILQRKHEQAKKHFEKVRNAFRERRVKTFLAFDIEVYEHDHSVLLEIGYVIVKISPARRSTQDSLPTIQVTSRKHLIIEENLHYKNGDRVPNNRDGFRFGISQSLSMADAVKEFCEDVSGSDYILGHSLQHDDAYLREIGVDLSKLRKEIFDTQVIYTYKESLQNKDKYVMRGLSYLLKGYKLNYVDSDLHNAGCDAFYTMMVFLREMDYTDQEVNNIIAPS